jgi:hypothetical protein
MTKKKVDCWMDDWISWLSQNNLTFPGNMDSFKMFLVSETDENQSGTTMMDKWKGLGTLGLDRSNTAKFTSIRITSTMDAHAFQTGEEIKEMYDNFEKFKNHINKDGVMVNAPVAFQIAEATG